MAKKTGTVKKKVVKAVSYTHLAHRRRLPRATAVSVATAATVVVAATVAETGVIAAIVDNHNQRIIDCITLQCSIRRKTKLFHNLDSIIICFQCRKDR